MNMQESLAQCIQACMQVLHNSWFDTTCVLIGVSNNPESEEACVELNYVLCPLENAQELFPLRERGTKHAQHIVAVKISLR